MVSLLLSDDVSNVSVSESSSAAAVVSLLCLPLRLSDFLRMDFFVVDGGVLDRWCGRRDTMLKDSMEDWLWAGVEMGFLPGKELMIYNSIKHCHYH